MNDPLPPPGLAQRELDELRKSYADLLGFVPPRVAARTDLMSRLDPEGLLAQEQVRAHFLSPGCFDAKTTQLMVFGMLLVNLQDAARLHAIAARRAGATWEELMAVVGLAYLFRGLPAANVGSHVLKEVAVAEQEGGRR